MSFIMRLPWLSDWQSITGSSQYLGARILFRPMDFRSIDWPEFNGEHVISLGYTFPTNLTKNKGFSVGDKDNFGISVSWEDANKPYPLIFALSYRRSQVQEEDSPHQTAAHYSTKQESARKTRIHHTLMLEASLGCQLFSSLVLYGGGGIGLSLAPENTMAEEGEGSPIAKDVPWQVQVEARVSLLNLLYIRVQTAYLHTGELLPSLHLGVPLF